MAGSAGPRASAPGRRARARAATMHQLRVAALDEVRERGGAGLSLRSVARRMGMSAPGLYRYVASREDLLTLLIADGFDDLADHLLVAIGSRPGERRPADEPPPPLVAMRDGDVADRLRALALAYRDWAVRHPNEFGLLFAAPIPGYEAPVDGPTTAAMGRVGAAMADPVIAAWHARRLRLHPALATVVPAERLAPLRALADEALPPQVYTGMLLAWGRLHGQVSLEVFGHHAWLFPDGCEPLFRAEVEAMLVDLGVVEA
jgi:AcrR family transcriptional regulator